jgi:4-alpha-glucanotransferase
MPNEPLDRLAALAGIESGWIDFFGKQRLVSDDTKRVFLSAMGLAVDSDDAVARTLSALETEPWRSRLPSVVVASADQGAPSVTVTLPKGLENAALTWSLREENGTLHQGNWRPREAPMSGRREVDGRLLERYTLTLPGLPFPGIHHLEVTDSRGEAGTTTLIFAPATAYLPPAFAEGRRLWGYATQLYGVRSRHNWGVGDFSDLALIARGAAAQGASAVGVNPLHALFAARPERYSPYSPSSRTFLNIGFIDIEAVPDFAESPEAARLFGSAAFQRRLAEVRAAEQIDYLAVAALKRPLFAACWQSFQKRHLAGDGSQRGTAFRRFRQQGGRSLRLFATFEALQAEFLSTDPDRSYWRTWPVGYHDPDGADVQAFTAAHDDGVGFHIYLQWLADQQLAAAETAARQGGMSIGLYRDLAVGISDDGAEAWANQSLLCMGVSVGAPPDPLNLSGQDWGLVPLNPLALRKASYLPFLEILEANMRHAGALRLDHAMSLQRLYWVPQGAKADQGAYVRYPVDDLFRLAVLASVRQRCLIIGEDLGTVPDGFRERMAERSLLGYRLMVFERDGDKARSAETYPSLALVGFGTHDLPSLAGWWQGIDIESRRRLALYTDPALGVAEVANRAEDRRRLVDMLVAAGELEPGFSLDPILEARQLQRLSAAVHSVLARTPSKLLMVQFEDLLGWSLQMNLPGTVDQHPNWRVRYPTPIEDMLEDGGVTAVAGRLSAVRG